VLVSSYITPKARKGAVSGIEGRGLGAVAPIAAGELVAIKGGHIVTTAALRSLPERLRNSEIQIADGLLLLLLSPAQVRRPPGSEPTAGRQLNAARGCPDPGGRWPQQRNAARPGG